MKIVKKDIYDIIGFTFVLAWIPLGVTAFLLSPVRIDIKLFIAACVSAVGLLCIWLKEN